mmetsp:Transcript_60879/g.173037  ORF Transcript_60879/g.173037 Transcript_60879/m.173037 type:complete len:207 (+) Transcript_60879:1068-1688(+)
MCRPETTAVVAAVAAHAHDQASALQVLDHADLVLRLHAGKDCNPLPEAFKLSGTGVQVPPCCLSHSKLRISRRFCVQLLATCLVDVRVDPNQLPVPANITKKHDQGGNNAALAANANAGQGVVAGTDHRPHGALLEVCDGLGRAILHLVAEKQQPTGVETILQAVACQVRKLLLRHCWRQGLGGDSKGVVALLCILTRANIVVSGH